MADERLNKVGLNYFWNRLKTVFATKTEVNTLSDRVDDIVSEGGEPNTIKTVKVNSTPLVPDADKAVDITTPTVVQNQVGGYTEVNVYQDAVRSQNHLNIRYKEEDEYVSVFVGGVQGEDDGVQLAPKSSIPTAVSDLTNDSGYQTAADVTSAIETRLTAVYKPKGSIAFASLPALTSANEGFVYNVTDSFTTTADFIDGAGKEYPAGTNVAIVSTTGDTYKYDVLAGFVDLSTYWNATNLPAITTAEIDAIIDGE